MNTMVKMSESDLLVGVLDACRMLGYRTLHIRPARAAGSWRTAVQGGGIGFPDVLAIRGKKLVVAELKSSKGRLSDEQDRWLSDFAIAGADCYVWRPSDYPDRILEALR